MRLCTKLGSNKWGGEWKEFSPLKLVGSNRVNHAEALPDRTVGVDPTVTQKVSAAPGPWKPADLGAGDP